MVTNDDKCYQTVRILGGPTQVGGSRKRRDEAGVKPTWPKPDSLDVTPRGQRGENLGLAELVKPELVNSEDGMQSVP